MKVRIGTRGSKLALWQAETVKSMFCSRGIEADLVLCKTLGDINQQDALSQIGGVGLFTKALDEMLLRNEVDLVVHSAKDMPSVEPDGINAFAFLKREDPRDVLLSLNPELDLDNFTGDFLIGTSSLRRQAFLRHYAPHLRVGVIRGNLDTRVEKMKSGEFDGILLAFAGVKRMGFDHLIVRKLNASVFVPAVGQGAIAVVCNVNDPRMETWAEILNHKLTEIAVKCERAFLHTVEGGCQTPVFGLATVIGETISLHAGIAEEDGSAIWQETLDGTIYKGQQTGVELAHKILAKSGKRLS